jgi:hypothetical protein
MCRRILIFNLRLLIALAATALLVLPVQYFALSSEEIARHWNLPAFAITSVTVFALAYAARFRVFRPRLQWPRRIVWGLTALSTLAVLGFVFVAFLFAIVSLGGSGDQEVPRSQIPANATNLDLSCTAVLDRFQGNRRALLERYLASSAAWQVTDDDGRRVALRRRFHGGHWQTELNMYFTEPDGPSPVTPQLQSSHRTRIFLDGTALAPYLVSAVHGEAPVGASSVDVPLVFNRNDAGHFQSRLWIRGTDMAIEIDDGSDTMPRDLTRTKLSEVCKELDQLENQESSLGIDSILPEGSVATSEMFSIDGELGDYQAAGYAGLTGSDLPPSLFQVTKRNTS